MTVLLVLAAWLGVSIPVAVVTGRAIGRAATVYSYPPTSGPSGGLLDRLQQIELEEIPRVRLALEGWADDPHLCTELRVLTAEAQRLRRVLDATTDRRTPDADVQIVAWRRSRGPRLTRPCGPTLGSSSLTARRPGAHARTLPASGGAPSAGRHPEVRTEMGRSLP